MRSILVYILAIVLCGALGALVGWVVSGAIGLTGTPMAMVAAFVGMLVATGLWVLGTVVFLKQR